MRDRIENGVEALGLEVAALPVDRIEQFALLVLRANLRLKLVSRRDEGRLVERHLLESLSLVPLLVGCCPPAGPSARRRIADLGSGGGLPGIPLAMALEETDFLLIERSRSKATFLRQVALELKLTNVEVVCADAREAVLAPVNAVVSRAVAPAAVLWPIACPLLAAGGRLVAMDRRGRTAASRTACGGVHDGEFADGEIERMEWLEIPAHAHTPAHRHRVLVVRRGAR